VVVFVFFCTSVLSPSHIVLFSPFSVTFYAGFHFLTFLVGNYLYVPLPGNGASMLWVALALDLAVFVYWGVVNPPRSNSSCTVAKQPAQVSEPTKESITECQ